MARPALAVALLMAGLVMSITPAQTQSSLSYAIVDTGQSKHFGDSGAISAAAALSAFPGQDADYAGNQPTYLDNKDGTVTDQVTGLMWEQGYRTLEWADAEQVARQADTGGYSDWRVPTTKELYSLILFTGAQGRGAPESNAVPADAAPFIDTAVFDFAYPSTGRYIDVQFVTSTVYTASVMNGETCFFGVNFADGRIKCYPLARPRTAGQYHARFVRGNADYGSNAFTDNGDGTITDTATGLMWTTLDSGAPALAGDLAGALGWDAALRLAENSAYAGHNDWRLPNAKELHSIVDYTRAPAATGSAAIDPLFSVTPITNLAGEADFPVYWTSTSFEPGSDAVCIYFGRALGYFAQPPSTHKQFLDVHGAGAQRTNPKAGQDSYGEGPQGDVRTVNNYVRLVRDAG